MTPGKIKMSNPKQNPTLTTIKWNMKTIEISYKRYGMHVYKPTAGYY